MKRIIVLFLVCCNLATFAQGGALADLKFEEAETAFNSQDYETTIEKLDEFDKLLGSVSSKSLYLRIVSQNNLFDEENLYENQVQWKLLYSLQKNVNAYLKAMESEGLDDKYREVNKIYENIKYYPSQEAKAKEQKQEKDWRNMPEYVTAIDKGDVNLMKKAADKGNIAAMMAIALAYESGAILGLQQQDFGEAMKWYKKAADKGYSGAMKGIGNIYLFGKGVDKNEEEALKWYRLAANKGNAVAMNSIGYINEMKENQNYGSENYTEAFNWYLKSANNGEMMAMNRLASFYEDGKGVIKDLQKAKIWKQRYDAEINKIFQKK